MIFLKAKPIDSLNKLKVNLEILCSFIDAPSVCCLQHFGESKARLTCSAVELLYFPKGHAVFRSATSSSINFSPCFTLSSCVPNRRWSFLFSVNVGTSTNRHWTYQSRDSGTCLFLLGWWCALGRDVWWRHGGNDRGFPRVEYVFSDYFLIGWQ